jgi:hypothetical protein
VRHSQHPAADHDLNGSEWEVSRVPQKPKAAEIEKFSRSEVFQDLFNPPQAFPSAAKRLASSNRPKPLFGVKSDFPITSLDAICLLAH